MADDGVPKDFAGVVVAAGRSTRFGGSTPKQFRRIEGRTVLERSVEVLASHPSVVDLVVVVARDRVADPELERLTERYPGTTVVEGGATRADSVRRGLAAAQNRTFVLVHDAARPLASAGLVDAVVRATRRHGAAVPLLTVPDTVKRIAEEESEAGPWVEATLDRDHLRLAQTPQGARVDWLIDALDRAKAEGCRVTDEASALEHAGRRVAGVDGETGNRKITSRDDLEQARRTLSVAPAPRVGFGFDVHRFAEGRELVLGGVVFPDETGLEGHSDADVVLHAAMDAVLGPTGLGDIGCLFPPEDPAFAGADSRRLAREVKGRIADLGFEVVNLDLMLLAERPKIRPKMEQMRASIAAVFDIEIDRVGLKATTMERLGAIGRGEGIACQAVALLTVGEAS